MDSIRSGSLLALLLLACALAAASAHAVDKVKVSGLFKDRALLTIDGKQRLLQAGETSPEGVTLVRADSNEAVLEIDGVQSTHGLGADIRTGLGEPESRAVQIWPTSQNLYPVVGSINGYPVNFLVDTGATLVAMNSAQARRLGIDYAVEGTPSLAQTASGVSKIFIVTLARVRVGEIELTDVRGAVHEGSFPTEVLLGMSFLGRLDIRREGGMLELRKQY